MIEEEKQGATSEAWFGLKGGVREYILLVVGFGCMVGFARMCSLGFVGYLSYEVSSSLDPWFGLRAVCEVVTLAVLALAGRNGWFSLELKSIAVASACAVASAIVFAVDVLGVTGPLATVLGGISMAVLMYVWFLLLCSYAPYIIVAVTLPGLVLAGAIVEGAPLVGPDVGLIIAVGAAFASGACAVLVDPKARSCVSDGSFDASARERTPWLTVIMVVACGFLVSVLYGIAEYMTWLYDWGPNYIVFGAAALIAVVSTAAIVLKARSWVQIAWVPLFALFALAIVFSCLPMRSTVQVAMGLMMAAMFSAHFLYWMVLPALFSATGVPRAFAAGVLLVCTNGSLASLVGDALGSLLPRSMQNLGSVAGVMAIAVAALFAVAVVANRNRMALVSQTDGELHSERASQDVQPELAHASADVAAEEAEQANPIDALKARLDDLGGQHGLTPRESEVALYTVQGYSCAYIAEKLVVSNSTVRFHQQNIYRKFDVHSRNELIEHVSAE